MSMAVAELTVSRFEIGLATPHDDSEIRALLRRIVIPGGVQVVFEREPSFLRACRLHGRLCQVVVGRDCVSGEIIGIGTRSVDDGFINGHVAPLGYLSDLRLEPSYRGGNLIARGYKLFRRLHGDGRTRLYTTAIFSSNRLALNTIAQGRAGLPRYHDLGAIRCPGIALRKPKPRPEIDAGCEVTRGTRSLLPAIVNCLNRNNARRQFGLVHREQDFLAGGRWLGCGAENFYVALRDGEVAGVLAAWDQQGFKQTRIAGYDRKLGWALPLIDGIRRLKRMPAYPKPGEYLKALNIAFVAVDSDDLKVFSSLLRCAYNDAVASRYLFAMIGLHERDPLLPALNDYSLTPFHGRLFCVCYEDGEEDFRNLDGRVPYVEAAIL